MTSPVQPIPEAWRKDVVRILRRGDSKCIDWTGLARTDWQQFGDRFQAYDLLSSTLQQHGCLGRQVFGMQGAEEIWEFLCTNPIRGAAKPLYAKVGIKAGRLTIKIFSTHIDRKGELENAIAAWLKKHTPPPKQK